MLSGISNDKNHVLSKVSKAMQNQNYDLVLQLSEKSFYKRFMGSFVCDLYILRALLNKGDNIGFKKYLMETLEKPYTLEKRKEVLDIYFYHFYSMKIRNGRSGYWRKSGKQMIHSI